MTPLRRTHLPRAQYLEWLVAARLAPLRLARPGVDTDAIDVPLPARDLLLRAARAGDVHALIFSRPLVNGGLDVAWIKQLGELDVSQETPSRRAGSGQRQLQREATPLIDFLPEVWRSRIP